jgi:MFS family permease
MSSIDTPGLADAPDFDEVSTDPTRWVTLAITIVSAFIVVLDNTVLNVAIPTILREFDTSLSSLEWVITGYALTFATLLIIGGRLGDVYGHRRVFIIGAALFGVGSLIAALSQGVPQLILGEAIIEGIGASLMLPATLAILSGTFRGRERATAFAAWGATAGVAVAVGPVVGGFLTTNYSWRWAFGINVIIAPLAIVGAIFFMKVRRVGGRKIVLDVPGAGLIAAGMFLLVFALSEGAIYGWWKPIKDFSIAGHDVWPATKPISIIPIIFLTSAVILTCFYFLERWKERNDRDPLFEFKHLRLRTYRYGLLTGLIVAMGQLGITFVLPVFLQDGRHLTAVQNGWWQLPTGIFVIIGAQLGGRLIRYLGTTVVVRIGFLAYAIGIVLIFRAVSVDITALELFPGLAFYGIGIGFALAQLTNVVLSEIPKESSGVASGANTTVRQVGAALGVAVIGAILTTQTISRSTTQLEGSQLPAGTKADAITGIHALGANYSPPAGTSRAVVNVIQAAVEHGVVSGTRMALVFAFVMITIGGFISLLIPNIKAAPEVEQAMRAVENFEPVEPLDVDPALIEGATERAGTNGAATQRARG